jgi:large subunit ribosomal protein L27
MAHTKSGGTSKNLRDSLPKYLGVKITSGQKANAGSIIIRQKGNKFYAGENVKQGKDYTLFATKNGIVEFVKKRKTNYDGRLKYITVVNIKSPEKK